MTSPGITERLVGLPPEQRENVAERLRQAAATAAAEPIAVVGVGCRFPGGISGQVSYWEHLQAGWNAVRDVPADRWRTDDRATAHHSASSGSGDTPSGARRGGFLDDIAGFDADFFRISPQEAAAMDPQQRVLLEVACETLYGAGYPPETLAGSRTGFFAGVYYNDYLRLSTTSMADVGPYTTTGNAHSITASRLAYLFDLRGPAMAVDTACSSSLVAVHLACQALRLRECDAALAGGVSLILTPETQVALSRWGMLSPTGDCRAFDADADGIVRGEGAGAVLLKRLTDAIADGDQIIAVLRGSSVLQDGRSQGLTAPSTLAQRDVISEALSRSGVAAAQVSYVETHGTGTVLGDPIELDALSMVYGSGPGRCALGSVKTNMGHLEAAAGIAGLIKAVLAVHHGSIPPNLHFRRWNPAIDPEPSRFFVPTEVTAWPDGPGPRTAAVSSFGFGGTNAHVIVEQAPAGIRPPRASGGDPVDRWHHERHWGRPRPAVPGDRQRAHGGDDVTASVLSICAQSLGRQDVPADANFYDLGGDSLMAMRVVSLAKRQGIHLKAEDLRRSTIGGIASRLAAESGPVAPTPETGPPASDAPQAPRAIPLTPIQHEYLERQNPTPDAWDVQILVEFDGPLNVSTLTAAAEILVARHDALRLRVERTGTGWRQSVAPPGRPPAVVEELDLRDSSDEAALELIRSRAAEFQSARSLARGPILSLLYGDRGTGAPALVLVALHHLAVDTHSLWILLTDLFTACRQVMAAESIELPEPTTSYADWAAHLKRAAATPAVREQRPFWLAQIDRANVELPRDHDLGPDVLAAVTASEAVLDEHTTAWLLDQGTDTVPILATALVSALSGWAPSGDLLVDFRSHGRRPLAPDIDVDWSVGWFTNTYPVALPLGSPDALRDVRERLRQVPDHGTGHGLLRYLAPDEIRLPAHRPQVGFNYLGILDTGATGGPVRYAPRQVRAYPDQQAAIAWPLDLKAMVVSGRLMLSLIHSRNRYRRETVDALTARIVSALRTDLPAVGA